VAGIAVAMGLTKTEEFKNYQRETVKNSQVLGKELQQLGYKIVTGGTDNHIILCDLSPKKLSGSKAERILELVGISVNKNTVPGDKSAMNPSGVRFGTPSLTTRKFSQEDMKLVVQFIHRAFELALEIQALSGPKLVDWLRELGTPKYAQKVSEIKKDVETMALKFPLPGKPEY
jgi:glycine hydroxymethyltransferase